MPKRKKKKGQKQFHYSTKKMLHAMVLMRRNGIETVKAYSFDGYNTYDFIPNNGHINDKDIDVICEIVGDCMRVCKLESIEICENTYQEQRKQKNTLQ